MTKILRIPIYLHYTGKHNATLTIPENPPGALNCYKG